MRRGLRDWCVGCLASFLVVVIYCFALPSGRSLALAGYCLLAHPSPADVEEWLAEPFVCEQRFVCHCILAKGPVPESRYDEESIHRKVYSWTLFDAEVRYAGRQRQWAVGTEFRPGGELVVSCVLTVAFAVAFCAAEASRRLRRKRVLPVKAAAER